LSLTASSKKSTMAVSFPAVLFLLLILIHGSIAGDGYRRGLRGELPGYTRRAKTANTLDCLNNLCLPTPVHVDQTRGVRKTKQNEGSFAYDVFEPKANDSVNTDVTAEKNRKSMKARFKPRPTPEAAISDPGPSTLPPPPVSVSITTPPSSPVDESLASQAEDSPSPTHSPSAAGVKDEVVPSPRPMKSSPDHVPAPIPEAAEPEGNLDTSPTPMDDEALPSADIDGDKNEWVSGQKGGVFGSESDTPAPQSDDPKETSSSRKTTGFFATTIAVFVVATLICFVGPRLREQPCIQLAKKATTVLHEDGSITSEDEVKSACMDRSFEESPYVSGQAWTELHFEDFLASPEDHRESSPLQMLRRSRTSPACMVMRVHAAEEERSLNSDLSERRRATPMNLMPTFDEYLEDSSCEEAKIRMPSIALSESSAAQAPIQHIQFKSLSHLELGSMSSMYSSVENESVTDDEPIVHEGINDDSCLRDGIDEKSHKVDEQGGKQQELHPQDKSPLHPPAAPPSPHLKIHQQSPPHTPSRLVPPHLKNTLPRVCPKVESRLPPPPNDTPSTEANESAVPRGASPIPRTPEHRVPTSRAGVNPNFLKMLGRYSADSMDEDEVEHENHVIGDFQRMRRLADNDVADNHTEDCDVDTVDDEVASRASSTYGGIDPRFLQRIGMNVSKNENEASSSVLPGDSSSSSSPPSFESSFNSKQCAPGDTSVELNKTIDNHP
jgi:hypothetical protein